MLDPVYGACCFSDKVTVFVLALKVNRDEETLLPFIYKLTFLAELKV